VIVSYPFQLHRRKLAKADWFAPTAAQECYNWHRNKAPSLAARGRKFAAIRRKSAWEGNSMKRNASATWKRGPERRPWQIQRQRGVLKDVKYSFRTRFEDEPGTNRKS